MTYHDGMEHWKKLAGPVFDEDPKDNKYEINKGGRKMFLQD